jgi:hypothetical protein
MNIHFCFFKKITICVNRWYICIYTIDLIFFGNVDENLVVFDDDFQIITFNTFYLSLYSMILFFNKEQSLIHVHSRNLMHFVLIHVLHQPHVCHRWIEFGLINILFSSTIWQHLHHNTMDLSHMQIVFLGPITSSHIIFIKTLWHSEELFTFCLGTYCSNRHLLIIILWCNHPLFRIITYPLLIIAKVLHFHP